MGIILKAFSIINVVLVLTIAIFGVIPINSGHISWEPFMMFLYFVPLLCVSIFIWVRNQSFKRIATFNASIAITGIILIVLLDLTNALVQYDRWAKRGLPSKGDISWIGR